MSLRKNFFTISLLSTCCLTNAWAMDPDKAKHITTSTAKLSISSENKEDHEALYLSGRKAYKAKNYSDAFKAFKTAAEQGDPKAQCYLGCLYRDKKGLPEMDIPQADTLAVHWFAQADKLNFPRGTFLLADMYEQGKGIPEAEKSTAKQKSKELKQKAFLLFKKTPPTDNRSQYNLAQMYQFREGISEDELEKADEKAVYWYTKAANQEDEYAQYSLSWMYAEGKGVPKNETAAFNWCKKAAENGDSDAQLQFAWEYLKGNFVEKNLGEAVRWCKKAAVNGNSNAQAKLVPLEKGLQDLFGICKKDAEDGNPDAQLQLVVLYENGDGVAQNEEEAFRLCKKLAENGNPDAQLHLAAQYANGIGIERDSKEALKWCKIVAETGHVKAQASLKVFENLERWRKTQEQIAKDITTSLTSAPLLLSLPIEEIEKQKEHAVNLEKREKERIRIAWIQAQEEKKNLQKESDNQ